MSLPELERLARAVHQQYPEPGMAFYGTKDDSPATLALVAAAHQLAATLYPRKTAK
jgi:hypothetical protein